MTRPLLRLLRSRRVAAPAIAAAVVLSALVLGGVARADGDPASDVLLYQDVFLSMASPADSPEGRALNVLAQEARRAKLPIRVAVIASPGDLGAVTGLFEKPADYARFLSAELLFNYKGTLLVVMPSGFGLHGPGATPAATRALAALPPPNTSALPALANAAAEAMVQVEAANGHRLALPPGATVGGRSRGGASTSLYIGIGLAAGVIVLAGLLTGFLVRRRARADGTDGSERTGKRARPKR